MLYDCECIYLVYISNKQQSCLVNVKRGERGSIKTLIQFWNKDTDINCLCKSLCVLLNVLLRIQLAPTQWNNNKKLTPKTTQNQHLELN